MKRLVKNKVALTSFVIIVLITLSSVFIPFFWPYAYDSMLGVRPGDPDSLPLGGNTAISCLRCENGVFTPEYIGDCAHLAAMDIPVWEQTPDLRAEAIDPMREAAFYTACYEDAWRAAHGTTRGFSPEKLAVAG